MVIVFTYTDLVGECVLQLIVDGARSEKSRLAEQIAQQLAQPVFYVAPAPALAGEMQVRSQHHQQQRPEDWGLCEEPIYLAAQLLKLDRPNQTILVDCLTLWMSNLLMHTDPDLQVKECQKLLDVVGNLQSELILGSN